jgi:hypothetical protein
MHVTALLPPNHFFSLHLKKNPHFLDHVLLDVRPLTPTPCCYSLPTTPSLSENVSHYSLDLYPYSAIIPEMSISETLISLHYLVCPCQEDITHPLDHSLEMAAPPNA